MQKLVVGYWLCYEVSLEADGVNEDESSDDELPSLQKLLSPTMSLSGNLPALIPSTSPSKRPGAQRRFLQASRLLRENAYLITLNGRSFNIRPRKHQAPKFKPRLMTETVRVG
jgi:hypothetical protein